jgi:hypothetical protein
MTIAVLFVGVLLIPAFAGAGESRATKPATGRAAAGNPFSRFCKAHDLVGTWHLVKYTTPYEFKDPNAPYLLPYQVFQFTADGNMKSAHSPKPFRENPGKMFQAIPAVVTYGFERDGLVTVRAKGAAAAAETWHCVAITQDRNDEEHQVFMKRGDLVMTLVGKNGQPLFVRQLRKSGT